MAVGVPTREGAGSVAGAQQLIFGMTSGLPGASETCSKTVDGEGPKESQEGSSSSATTDQCQEQRTMATPASVTEELSEATENGWDIPDISDLLDSLNDQDGETLPCPEGDDHDSLLCPTEDTVHQDTQCEVENLPSEGETAEDSENNSWDWNTTNWTTEHSHTNEGDQTQTQHMLGDKMRNGKPTRPVALHSLAGPTHSYHHPMTDHTAKTSQNSNDNIH